MKNISNIKFFYFFIFLTISLNCLNMLNYLSIKDSLIRHKDDRLAEYIQLVEVLVVLLGMKISKDHLL